MLNLGCFFGLLCLLLLLVDPLHSTWWAVQMLVQRGVDLVMPNDGRRRVDFSEDRIHSESDYVVWWPKPKRLAWIGKAQYEQMPAGIWVREVSVNGTIIVTTMMESTQISPEDLVVLYAMRWSIEVDFRTLKVARNMDVLRCKSPNMVKKEIAVYFLTYNLVRWTMVRAAQLVNVAARDLSFRLSSAPVPRSHDKLPCAHVAAQHFPLRLTQATWSH